MTTIEVEPRIIEEPEIEEEFELETTSKGKIATKTSIQPPWHVLIHNDDDHSFAYVIVMLKQLFGHPAEKGLQLAKNIHEKGKAVVYTCSRELAELKQEQVHAFGKDYSISRCKGSMTCTIEVSY